MKRNQLWDLAFQLITVRELKKQATVPIPIPSTGELKKFNLKEIHSFPEPRQGKWIEAGETDVVWNFNLPAGDIAFITAIGLGFIRKGEYYFYKGTQKVDSPSSTRVYGSIDNPTTFPIGLNVSYSDIIFKGRNDDDQKGYFEVLCRGFYIKKDLVDELFAMLGRTGIEVLP